MSETDKLNTGLAAIMQGDSLPSVIGGIGNPIASGNGASIVSGNGGIASGEASLVLAGQNSVASGTSSVTIGGIDNEVTGIGSICIGGASTLLEGNNSVCIGGSQIQMTLQGNEISYVKGPLLRSATALSLPDGSVITGSQLQTGYLELANSSTNSLDIAANVATSFGLTADSFIDSSTRFIFELSLTVPGGGASSARINYTAVDGYTGKVSGPSTNFFGAAIMKLVFTSATTCDVFAVDG